MIDNVSPPTTPIDLEVEQLSLSGTGGDGASAFDVVRGRFGIMGSNPFASAQVDACVTAATVDLTVTFDLHPPDGEAWWLLVRARNCGGPGTWDAGDPSQVGSHDAEIDASASTCP